VIAHGAEALRVGGRWAVLDLKTPDQTPSWMLRFGIAVAPPSAELGAWAARRPWDTIRVAMRDDLDDASWTQLCFGTAFLAVGAGRGRVT
jgi:demethylmenaquinone methyltransferase/2-methoxy-6-polyprenyl-1,4-benzoquinol methylase